VELHRATIRALRERSVRLAPAAFGDLVHAYLSRTGATDIERVKRTDDTTYLVASRGGVRWLVGARAGGGEGGRRSVGELRAGVVATGRGAGLPRWGARPPPRWRSPASPSPSIAATPSPRRSSPPAWAWWARACAPSTSTSTSSPTWGRGDARLGVAGARRLRRGGRRPGGASRSHPGRRCR